MYICIMSVFPDIIFFVLLCFLTKLPIRHIKSLLFFCEIISVQNYYQRYFIMNVLTLNCDNVAASPSPLFLLLKVLI